jgi:hypothetical protein
MANVLKFQLKQLTRNDVAESNNRFSHRNCIIRKLVYGDNNQQLQKC